MKKIFYPLTLGVVMLLATAACEKEDTVPSKKMSSTSTTTNSENSRISTGLIVSPYEWGGEAHNYALTKATANSSFGNLSILDQSKLMAQYFNEYAVSVGQPSDLSTFDVKTYERIYEAIDEYGGAAYYEIVKAKLSDAEKAILNSFETMASSYDVHKDRDLFMEQVRTLEASIPDFPEVTETGIRTVFMKGGLALARHTFILWREGNEVIDPPLSDDDGTWKADIAGYFDVGPPDQNCICPKRRWQSASNASWANDHPKETN